MCSRSIWKPAGEEFGGIEGIGACGKERVEVGRFGCRQGRNREAETHTGLGDIGDWTRGGELRNWDGGIGGDWLSGLIVGTWDCRRRDWGLDALWRRDDWRVPG